MKKIIMNRKVIIISILVVLSVVAVATSKILSSRTLYSYPISGTAPLLVYFSATNLINHSSYTIDFGDETLTQQIVRSNSGCTNNLNPSCKTYIGIETQHTYASSGIYQVKLQQEQNTIGTTIVTVTAK